MKQSFLDSLTNKTVDEALNVIKESGYKGMVVSNGDMMSMMLRPKTIILWKNKAEHTVTSATLGDSSELES
jgi:hypothetical protein